MTLGEFILNRLLAYNLSKEDKFRSCVQKMTPQEVESDLQRCWIPKYRQPKDVELILDFARNTNLCCDSCCQRAILELCRLKMSCAERDKFIGSRCLDDLYKDLRSRPKDAELILGFARNTNFCCDSCCQRAILELCCLKMSCTERDKLIGSGCRDDLYKKLRLRQLHATPDPFDMPQDIRLLNERWYDVVEIGHRNAVDALYQIITANPQAFCQMLA